MLNAEWNDAGLDKSEDKDEPNKDEESKDGGNRDKGEAIEADDRGASSRFILPPLLQRA